MELICPFKTMVNGLVLIWPHSTEVEHSKLLLQVSFIYHTHIHTALGCTMSKQFWTGLDWSCVGLDPHKTSFIFKVSE